MQARRRLLALASLLGTFTVAFGVDLRSERTTTVKVSGVEELHLPTMGVKRSRRW